MGSLSALSHGSQQLVRVPYGFRKAHDGPCGCHTGFKHPYATPVETAIRISKPPKEPIRDPLGGCTIISKAHRGSYTCGPVCDKYGPVRLSMGRLRTKLVGSPCLKVVDAQLSATGYMAPLWVKTYFKDRSGPHSTPCGYPRVLWASALTRPVTLPGSLICPRH